MLSLLFFLLTCLLLTHPVESLSFSLNGLQLWFNRMVPSLLPFMILSGIMVRLNLSEPAARLLSPVLTPLLQIRANGIYAILVGFLCGFPMGAKVIAELYSSNKLSKSEASYLLAFCNNIGPVYFISFVLPALGLKLTAPYLFAMYGLPFLYGFLLRHVANTPFVTARHPLHEAQAASSASSNTPSLLDTLDDAILSGLYSISKLGGYMILFNLLNLLPQVFLRPVPIAGTNLHLLINCLLEITSGISRMGSQSPLCILLLLPMGGFSCLAQTYSMIKDTDLSFSSYVRHKLCLTGMTCLYYGLWKLLFPASFLL